MFKKNILKSEFTRNVLTLMTGTTIAQAIPIAISPILTRFYTPEDFGVFALYLAIVGVLSVIVSGRYEQAIMIPRYEKYAVNIFMLSLLIILLSFFVLLISTVFFKELISDLVGYDFKNWLYLLPFTATFIALSNVLISYNNRLKTYKDISNATITKSIVLSIVQVCYGLLKSGFGGLIVGQLLSSICANYKLSKNILNQKTLIKQVSILKMKMVAKHYKKFPKFNMPHAFINSLSASLPIYFFSHFFDKKIVGYYSLSMMVVLTPLMILAGSTAKVYNQKITQIYNQKANVYQFTFSIIKNLIKLIIIPFGIFITFAPKIFNTIFGSDWYIAGEFLQILSPWIFMVFIVSTIAYLSSIYGQQKKAMLIEFVYFLLRLTSLWLGCYVFRDVYVTLGLYSALSTLVVFYNFMWLTKLIKYNNTEKNYIRMENKN